MHGSDVPVRFIVRGSMPPERAQAG